MAPLRRQSHAGHKSEFNLVINQERLADGGPRGKVSLRRIRRGSPATGNERVRDYDYVIMRYVVPSVLRHLCTPTIIQVLLQWPLLGPLRPSALLF